MIRSFVLVAATAGLASVANAQFASIRTNNGGADAELRESETTLSGTTVVGANRGASTELAARGIDDVTVDGTGMNITNPFPTNDRSSVSLVRFDISSLPNHTDTGFWATDSRVQFRLYVRGTNVAVGRVFGQNPSNPAEEVDARIRVRALDPTKVYGDDNPSAFNRVDRTGTAYTASQNKYNWDESGVTFYNAPGITPHRVDSTAGSVVETLGLYDDFNSDVLDLGSIRLRDFGPTGLPQGSMVMFDGNALKDLVFDAQDANRTSITLMFHLENNTQAHKPLVGRPGVTPQNFLNFNYVFTPKEQLAQSGGPVNTNGSFSPELRVVPEPACIGLILSGGMVLLRRKRA